MSQEVVELATLSRPVKRLEDNLRDMKGLTKVQLLSNVQDRIAWRQTLGNAPAGQP